MAQIIYRTCCVCQKSSSYTLGRKDGTAICRWCARKRDQAEGKPAWQWTQLPNLYLD